MCGRGGIVRVGLGSGVPVLSVEQDVGIREQDAAHHLVQRALDLRGGRRRRLRRPRAGSNQQERHENYAADSHVCTSPPSPTASAGQVVGKETNEVYLHARGAGKVMTRVPAILTKSSLRIQNRLRRPRTIGQCMRTTPTVSAS